MAIFRKSSGNVCGYVGCKRHIRSNYFLCPEHHEDYEDGFVDQCPICGRFKNADYDLCWDCHRGRPVARWAPPAEFSEQKKRINVEHSKAWEKGDKEARCFFVYILKQDGGKFYIGHTRELRERLSEHMDGKTASIKGSNPRLQYFEMLPTREAAECREADLKKVAESNPREIRRMIIGFKDLVDELNYE